MSPNRNGNFTASEIFYLLAKGKEKGSFGKPALTYIKQTNWERSLGRALETETNARPLLWGTLLEKMAFSLLGIEYKLCSSETLQHPKIKYLYGSPDGQKFDEEGTVIDLKCPITLSSFCDLVDPLYLPVPLTGMEAMNYVRENHKAGEQYYQQIVCNAILTNSKYGELIVFLPYRSELEVIRDYLATIDDLTEQRKYYWISQAQDEELPFLPDGGIYRNLNVLRFEIPEQDKKDLIAAVYRAGELLIDWPE